MKSEAVRNRIGDDEVGPEERGEAEEGCARLCDETGSETVLYPPRRLGAKTLGRLGFKHGRALWRMLASRAD